MYTRDQRAAEHIREIEHQNRMLQGELEQALQNSASLNSRSGLLDAIDDHNREVAALNSVIADWKLSYNAMLKIASDYREQLNIDHSELIKAYLEKIKSIQIKKDFQPNPIDLFKYLSSLISKNEIYDIGPNEYLSWNDIRKHWDGLAKNGNPQAQFNMGWYFSASSNSQEALEWFKLASNQGEPKSKKEIEKIENKNLSEKSKEVALLTSKLLNDGSIETALQTINDSIKSNYDWANLLEPYLKISFERIVHKNFFYKTTDEKGQKIKSFVQYCEIDIKNNSDTELSIARPGSRLPARQRQESTSKFIKLLPNQSIKVQIWALPPNTEADKENYSSYEWIYPNFDYFKIPFRLPSNLKLDIYHRYEKANCFVLTACFNDHDHPTVLSFRKYRDSHMSRSRIGRVFINQYYKYGPVLANWIQERPKTKALMRYTFKMLARLLPQ
jgi:hypothetical protein